LSSRWATSVSGKYTVQLLGSTATISPIVRSNSEWSMRESGVHHLPQTIDMSHRKQQSVPAPAVDCLPGVSLIAMKAL
jgi:hypothetical protein